MVFGDGCEEYLVYFVLRFVVRVLLVDEIVV